MLWGADQLGLSEPLEAFADQFVSAQHNALMQARVAKYLNDSFDQISVLVDRSKDEGLTDPALSTATIALFLQALEIGVHMVMAGGIEKDSAPSSRDWQVFLARVFDASRPPQADEVVFD